MRKAILKVVYCFIIRNFLKLIVGLKFERADFLTKMDRFVIIANHNSHLDTMAILASLPSNIVHKVKPVAAKDYFGRTKLTETLSNYFLNTLLIKRAESTGDHTENPVRQMIRELDKGNSLIVFPEGSRGEPEVMQPLKKGIALVLLERPDIQFIPAFTYGIGKALPKGDGILLPFTSCLKYGNPQMTNYFTSKEDLVRFIEQKLLEIREKIYTELDVHEYP